MLLWMDKMSVVYHRLGWRSVFDGVFEHENGRKNSRKKISELLTIRRIKI